jgi:hypothetical protein
MLDATDAFVAQRPDFPIKIGLYSFSSAVRTLRAIQPYDRDGDRDALAQLPEAGGGTAIGDAMREARPDLYRAGVFRKYLLVVTDGENTQRPQPDRRRARDLGQEPGGRAERIFGAFDRAPRSRVPEGRRRDVIGAGTGAELRTAAGRDLPWANPRRSDGWGRRTGKK